MDYSYLGAGKCMLREFGAAAPFIEVGNCSALSFGITEQAISQKDYTKPGGGTFNEVKRVEGVDCNMTLCELSPKNLARALMGGTTNTAAGTGTDVPVVAYEGGFTPLPHVPLAIQSVEPAGGGAAYVEGTD